MTSKQRIGLKVVMFLICLGLIVVGQKHIGYAGTVQMLAGLSGLLVLLWDYNRRYQ